MNQVTLSADGKTADIGPGNRWSDVAMALQPTGKIVVGGRLGGVGVGGYLLGGGLSFLSSQHGLACDTIVDYTVVIANGTIVHANYQTNQDLFFALRGGGNSFGLVTNFKMKAFPIAPQVWGGTRIYSADKIPAVFNASVDVSSPCLPSEILAKLPYSSHKSSTILKPQSLQLLLPQLPPLML